MGTQNFTDVAWPGLTFSEGFCPAKVRLNSSAETQINRQRAEMCEYLRSNILSRGKKKEEEKLSCLVLLWNCGFLKKKKKKEQKNSEIPKSIGGGWQQRQEDGEPTPLPSPQQVLRRFWIDAQFRQKLLPSSSPVRSEDRRQSCVTQV